MAVQVITPQQESFDLHVSLPKEYLGKRVIAFFTLKKKQKALPFLLYLKRNHLKKKMSDFAGIFTKEEADSFEKHTQRTRKEWDRTS